MGCRTGGQTASPTDSHDTAACCHGGHRWRVLCRSPVAGRGELLGGPGRPATPVVHGAGDQQWRQGTRGSPAECPHGFFTTRSRGARETFRHLPHVGPLRLPHQLPFLRQRPPRGGLSSRDASYVDGQSLPDVGHTLTSASTGPLPEARLRGLLARFGGQKRRRTSRKPCYLNLSQGTPVPYWTEDPKYTSVHPPGARRARQPAAPVTAPSSCPQGPSGRDVTPRRSVTRPATCPESGWHLRAVRLTSSSDGRPHYCRRKDSRLSATDTQGRTRAESEPRPSVGVEHASG